jgi:hypothetical protein
MIGLALAVAPAQANDIASFKTVFSTDVAYAGYGGVRGGDGTGTLTVAGVSGEVTEAYLYWQGPTNSEDADSNAAISFDGTDITGTNIGLSSDNCWGFDNSQAYRADVTSLVDGNGAYPVADLIKPGVADISGLSLLVFFDDGDESNDRDVVLFEGNDSNVPDNGFDADGWNVVLDGINYDSGSASLDFHVADGQSFPEAAVTLNGTEVFAEGGIFEGSTVPNGPTAGNTSGGLWDIRSIDVTAQLTPGANTFTIESGYTNDCLSLVVAAINLPAGSAPEQPTTTTTTTSTTSTTAPAAESTTTTTTPAAPPPAAPQPVAGNFTG